MIYRNFIIFDYVSDIPIFYILYFNLQNESPPLAQSLIGALSVSVNIPLYFNKCLMMLILILVEHGIIIKINSVNARG